ncbi:enolase C-terminal domain-like protein [Dongia deserti]|uniref:enolase C-terminal domain-like protein n=1 Tax=Dongia deserti TaxID=2268030 RepID=UPI000E653AB9|nr:enolase C-terminal domain-like protein [Dongia deserti]
MPENSLTIRSLTARAVVAPLARPLRTASGEIPASPLLLIDVATEQGITGRAYLFAYTKLMLRALKTLIEDIDPLLKGKPCAPQERAAEFERTFRLLGRQGLLGMALSGIDMALWDVLGRALNQPVVALLGGTARPVTAYDSFGLIDIREDARRLEQALAQGFRAIKIKIGGGSLEADVKVVREVRGIIGDQARLMVDYNQSLTAPEAIRRLQALAQYDLTWVEEPVPAEDLIGHAAVRASRLVPVQTGENWWFAADLAKSIQAGASDHAMPDIMKIGGVTGWLKAAALAEIASLPVSSHIFIEASTHVMPVTPTALYLEYLDSAGAILKDPLPVIDGAVTARGPGLGMEWNESAVAKYAA